MPSMAFIGNDFNLQTSPPTPNGCAWYRQVLPSREVQKFGWETGVGVPRVSMEEGIGIAHEDGAYMGFDVYVFKLMMHETVPQLIRLMQGKGQRIIVDVDDFHFGLDKENVAFQSTDPHSNPSNNRMFFEMGIRAADTVTVSTDFLAGFYERRVRDVVLVRNALDTERFTPVVQPEIPTFGWVGATLWRSGDIELLRDWLPSFVKEFKTPVHHAGHIPMDCKHFGVRAGLKRVQTSPMAPITHYPAILKDINVGLVPLTRNHFNEAKSALKGLEYAASGIPFIATPTEEYRLLAAAGVGRLAETPDEWRDHAIELLDLDVRKAEAEKQRAIVEAKFHISVRGSEWNTALNG